MTRAYSILICLIFVLRVSSQDTITRAVSAAGADTSYFNKSWKKCKREKAHYYRTIEDKKYYFLVKDYYINGVMQMQAQCLSIEPMVYNGICTYYYKNGKKEQEGEYVNNKKYGVWNGWNESGNLVSSIDYNLPKEKDYDSSSWFPQNQSSLFVGNINYRYKVNSSYLNSGHGLGVEVGFNAGYFISQRLLLAPIIGMGTKDVLWNTEFSQSYLNDFDASVNTSALRGNDSIVGVHLSNVLNYNHVFHDRLNYYGLLIRLPFKYAPIVKLYKGSFDHAAKLGSSHHLGLLPHVSGDKMYDHAYYDITMPLNWGAEVCVYNGYTQVRDYDSETHPKWKKRKMRWCTNLFAFSLYVEKLDSKHTEIEYSDGYHTVSLSYDKIMSSSFVQKYGTTYNFGLRLSCGVY